MYLIVHVIKMIRIIFASGVINWEGIAQARANNNLSFEILNMKVDFLFHDDCFNTNSRNCY